MDINLNSMALLMAKAVLKDPDSGKSTVALVSSNESSNVREFVAQVISGDDPDVREVLESLSKDANEGVRVLVASNVHSSPNVLTDLSADPVIQVVQSAAGNPATPPAVLAHLSGSSHSIIVESVASNPSTPVATLESLAEMGAPNIRYLVALNPSTPVSVRQTLLPARIEDLNQQFLSLAESKDDLGFMELLARRLLWIQLAYHGAHVNLELVNANDSLDYLRLECFFQGEQGLCSWEVFLTDPIEDDNSEFDVSIFRDGLLDAWPSPLEWQEFAYGQVLPTPIEPEDDNEYERLCTDSWPSDWPSLLIDTGYGMWAYVDLAQVGHISHMSFMEALRGFRGIPAIGQVELVARGSVQGEYEVPIPCSDSVVIDVLQRVQAFDDASADSDDQRLRNAVLNLVEPLMVITPGVSSEILEFVLRQPSQMVAQLASANNSLPETVKSLAAAQATSALPEGCTIELGLTGRPGRTWDNPEINSELGLLVQESSSEARSVRHELSTLIASIMKVVPSPDEDGEDGEIETSVGRHKQFLQSMLWLGGAVFVPINLVDNWIESLSDLNEALTDEDCEPELVEELAFNSWAEQD